MHRQLLRVAALSLVTFGSGCFGCDGEPLLDLTRKSGNSDERFFLIDPLQNVAVGARLDVAVRDAEGSFDLPNPGRARNVSTTAPAVVSVEQQENGKLTLAGLTPGDARIEFDGVADQETIRDGFGLKVIEPKLIELRACEDGVYVRGAPALVPFHFADGPPESASNRAQGYGLYPLALTGAAKVNETHRDPFTVRVDIASDAASPVELRSTLPDDTNHAILQLIDASEITSVRVVQNGGEPASLRPGETQNVGLEIVAGDKRVCSALEVEIREKSPDTCQVVRNDLDPMMLTMLAKGGPKVAPVVLLGIASSVAIRAIEEGACELELVILTAGIELVKTLVFESSVARPRSSGGGGGFDD